MIPAPTKDLSEHLSNLRSNADKLYATAQKFLDAYLTIVGINDKDAKIGSSNYPQGFVFQKGPEQIAATRRITYRLPEAIKIEIYRAASGDDPALTSLVGEINRAIELGEDYSPLDELIAESLRAQYKNMNTP